LYPGICTNKARQSLAADLTALEFEALHWQTRTLQLSGSNVPFLTSSMALAIYEQHRRE
jgi:hypothetical protein